MTLSRNYEANVVFLDTHLRVDESFDLIHRRLTVGSDEMTLYYIDGFVKDDTMQKLMQYFIGLSAIGSGVGAARAFADGHIPYVEVDVTQDVEAMTTAVLSGAVLMVATGFGREAVIIDARTYPARTTEEPDSDRVMQGAHDGFVETLIFNTALIRRRIRDTRLTMHYINMGGASRTDVVVAYVDGVASEKLVSRVKEKLSSVTPASLTLGTQSLSETLICKKWYNPFPKIRTLERPDAAAAELLEGRVLVLCDTSPQVIVLPTSIFDFMQETDDYYFPPITGTYLRLVRHFVTLLSLVLTPFWYLVATHPETLPPSLLFLVPDRTALPLILQLFLAELAIDGLKLASMNTPSMLNNSLSVIGGLILGEFAVGIGWMSEDVIFYMAVVTIAGFSQQSYELTYAFKFMRVILLTLTATLGLYGFIGGLLFVLLLIATNTTLDGKRRYLYPVIPFNGRALLRLVFRLPKKDVRKNRKKVDKTQNRN